MVLAECTLTSSQVESRLGETLTHKSSIIFISLNVSNDGRERKSFTSGYFLMGERGGVTIGVWESGNCFFKCTLMRYVLLREAGIKNNEKQLQHRCHAYKSAAAGG